MREKEREEMVEKREREWSSESRENETQTESEQARGVYQCLALWAGSVDSLASCLAIPAQNHVRMSQSIGTS